MTVVRWRLGRLLVWDATCPDTFAESYRGTATHAVGEVTAMAEDTLRKRIVEQSGEHRSTAFLLQHLSITVHQGNSTSVLVGLHRF